MDLINLLFRANTKELDDASKKLDALGKKAKDVEGKAGTLGDGFKTLGGPIGGVIERAEDLKGRFDGAIGAMGRFAGPIGIVAAGAAAAGAALVGLTNTVAQALDKFNDLSDRTNIAADRLQFLDAKAKMVGLSVEDLTGGAERLAAKLAKQDEETGRVATAIEQLGINLRDMNGEQKSALQLQEEVIRAAAEATDKATAEGLAVQALGADYYKLRGAYKDAKEEQDQFYQRLRDIGFLLSPEQQKQVGAYGDNIDKLGQAFSGMANTVAAAVLPILNSVLEKIIKISDEAAAALRRWLNPSTLDRAREANTDAWFKVGDAEKRLSKIDGTPYSQTPAGERAVAKLKSEVDGLRLAARATERELTTLLEAEEALKKQTVNGAAGEGPRVTPGSGAPGKQKSDLIAGKDADGPYQAYLQMMDEKAKRDLAELKRYDEAEAAADKKAQALARETEAIRNMLDPMRVLNEEIRKVNENPWLSDEDKEAAVVRLSEKFVELQSAARKTGEEMDALTRIGMTAFQGFESAIMSFVETGKLSFRGMVSSILKDLARLIIQIKIIEPIMKAFKASMSAGGGGWGALWGNIIGAFGGARADGGDVRSGKTYLVGERGPELFTARSSGMIIPNHALSTGVGAQVVNVAVNVKIDGKSDPQQTANAVSMKIQEQFTRGIVRQEIATWQRGQRYAV